MRRLMLAAGFAASTLLVGCAASSVSPGAAAPASSSTSPGVTTPGDTDTDTDTDADTDLAGSYLASAVVGHQVVPGSNVGIEFIAGEIRVQAGCNGMGGTYTVQAGQLVLDGLSQTEKGCEQPLMDQDAWVAAFLSSSPTVSVVGDTVTLTGRGVVAESMQLQRAVDAVASPLENTVWQLETIVRGDIASSVPAGVTPTMTISGSRITFDAQCNGVGGTVVVDGGNLVISEVIGTLMACDGARGEMEALLVSTFQDAVPFTVDGNRLTVTGADGTVLVFTAAAVEVSEGSTPGDPLPPVVVSPMPPTQPVDLPGDVEPAPPVESPQPGMPTAFAPADPTQPVPPTS